METSQGTIKIELQDDKPPLTFSPSRRSADLNHYDGTIFHRVIPNFMIQGGGFQPGMKQKKTKAEIKNESANGLPNKKYTLAMARTNVPDSASSQFFINVADNDFLDRANARDRVGYCVFGRVVDGMDVVDKLKAVSTGSQGGH